jgi:hypothetical protein
MLYVTIQKINAIEDSVKKSISSFFYLIYYLKCVQSEIIERRGIYYRSQVLILHCLVVQFRLFLYQC